MASKDHGYLESRGWTCTGQKKMGYKTIKYWAHPLYRPPACGSFYQTDALVLQRQLDLAKEHDALHRNSYPGRD